MSRSSKKCRACPRHDLPSAGPLLGLRSVLVLVVALLAGLIAGVLGYQSTGNLPAAVLLGGSAGAAALRLSHTLLGH